MTNFLLTLLALVNFTVANQPQTIIGWCVITYVLFSLITLTPATLRKWLIIPITVFGIMFTLKNQYQHLPVYFYDIKLLGAASEVAKLSDIFIEQVLALIVLGAIIFYIVRQDTPKFKLSNKGLAASLIAFSIMFNLSPSSALEQFGQLGLLVSTMKSDDVAFADTEVKSGEINTMEMMNGAFTTVQSNIIDSTNIDIVAIQSEAYFDISKAIPTAKQTEYFKSIQKQGIYGEVTVPVFGGRTCNSEFEFLTSISNRIFPEGSVTFSSFLKSKTQSLTHSLQSIGFDTIGIHNYQKGYWERDVKYPLLGFNRFYGEEGFESPTHYGHWMSDKDMFNQIIKELTTSSGGQSSGASEATNKFIYGVTVQNHHSFDGLGNKKIYKNEEADVNRYGNGLKITDDSLKDFISKLNNLSKPTMVVFYGDHLPAVNDKFYKKEYFKDERNKYKSDYFIWLNDAAKKENPQWQNVVGTELELTLPALSPLIKHLIGTASNLDVNLLHMFTSVDEYYKVEYGRSSDYTRAILKGFNIK